MQLKGHFERGWAYVECTWAFSEVPLVEKRFRDEPFDCMGFALK